MVFALLHHSGFLKAKPLVQSGHKEPFETQLIKTQRQILGFNLKTRKAKQSATGSYLHLSQKIVILPPGMHRIILRLKPISYHFIFVSTAGMNGVHHYCPVSIAN